jgi:hypothetical protein
MTQSSRRTLIAVAVVAIVAAISIEWLWTSDEERVATALNVLQAAIEHRDLAAVETCLAPDVPFPSGVPGIPAGGSIQDGLATVFERVESLKLRRDDTTITFGDDGSATAVAKGSGHVETAGLDGLFAFEVEAHFLKQPDKRFLLDQVVRVRVEPGLH